MISQSYSTRRAKQESVEGEGRIELAARDLDGSVLAVGIRLPGGRFYLVDDTRKGNELLVYIGSRIRFAGVSRREDGQSILQVTEFSVF